MNDQPFFLADEHESLPAPEPQPEPPMLRCPECLRAVDACQCDTTPYPDELAPL
jgi:hypothetical protein